MRISPDEIIFWQEGFFQLNLTIVMTWVIMILLVVSSWLITKNLKSEFQTTRWQTILEIVVLAIKDQIEELGLTKARRYIGFIGTMFLFIVISNLLAIIPWYEPPTGSLSTTVALALCVFIAVPVFGIAESGIKGYLRTYIQPNVLMLPFNIIGEISRTISLAMRLFGNIMSGGLILTILLSIAPFFFPVLMSAFGMLTGVVQAYIFAILATVYIAAATEDAQKITSKNTNQNG
ncbi:F0F1 ATP synthase subunit A [Membranicola marinus]|uniref:ATP synthase subunit a n=1 Tax=Membranihabitans marinus TaxID=1227546 RepID=A0A953HNR6_9BACT|nr:F0F1 ATP synthase subunit A [Membranihabitans marinus]MBY5958987.1 F0F1 ATP synthase subunit A [Membranihabitans marinus]